MNQSFLGLPGGKPNAVIPKYVFTTLTTENHYARPNVQYFIDISGITANRNLIIRAGKLGDAIDVSLTAGINTFGLIVIGDTHQIIFVIMMWDA